MLVVVFAARSSSGRAGSGVWTTPWWKQEDGWDLLQSRLQLLRKTWTLADGPRGETRGCGRPVDNAAAQQACPSSSTPLACEDHASTSFHTSAGSTRWTFDPRAEGRPRDRDPDLCRLLCGGWLDAEVSRPTRTCADGRHRRQGDRPGYQDWSSGSVP